MAKKQILFLLAFVLSFSLVHADSFGLGNPSNNGFGYGTNVASQGNTYINETNVTNINNNFYGGAVNETQMSNSTGVINILESWLNTGWYKISNPLNFINNSYNVTYAATSADVTANRSVWFSTYNSTYANKAGTGNCPAGQVVMNTTTNGVQCVSSSSSNPFNQNLNTTSNVAFNNTNLNGYVQFSNKSGFQWHWVDNYGLGNVTWDNTGFGVLSFQDAYPLYQTNISAYGITTTGSIATQSLDVGNVLNAIGINTPDIYDRSGITDGEDSTPHITQTNAWLSMYNGDSDNTVPRVDWLNMNLYDGTPWIGAFLSVDWHNRILYASDGTTVNLDWNTPNKVKITSGSSYNQKVVCYADANGTLGHCTSIVGVTGGCTCVAN